MLTVAISLLLTSCASVTAPDDRDPWESFNRAIYAFNDGLDRAIVRPVAEVYKEKLPEPVTTSVNNAFSNVDDILVTMNDLLQFKFEQALKDFTRFLYNTTFGLFGLFDVATHMDLPKNNEDFGQTLATWGVANGPYLVLPILGPSNVRDTVGLYVDGTVDPVYHIEDEEARWSMIVLRAVDKRANLLEATRIMEKSGIDPYVFLRDAYFQHRENLIHDGNPPRPKIRLDAPTQEDLDLEKELELELNK